MHRGHFLFFERLCFFGLIKERLGVGVKAHSTARNFPHRPKEALYTWGLFSPKPRTFFSLQRQKKAKAPFIIPKEKEQLSKVRYDDAAK